MFGSIALDVTIGLVFVFLLYSLLATIINEIIATFIGMRARFLRKGIERMLNDEYLERYVKGKDSWYNFKILCKRIWIRMSGNFLIQNYRFKNTLADAFYTHPSIYYLGENKFHSKPSYLKSENFSYVLTSVLNGRGKDDAKKVMSSIEKGQIIFKKTVIENGLEVEKDEVYKIDKETQAELKDRLEEAEGDLKKFRISLEKWFDDTMDRASGWYKRKVQALLFTIGLVLSMFFNVNTFNIVSVLSKDKDARNQLVTLAGNVGKQEDYGKNIALANDTTTKTKDAPDSLLQQRLLLLRKAYSDINKDAKDATHILAMGWGFDTVNVYALATDPTWKKTAKNFYFKARFVLQNTFNPLSNLFGFMVTSLALSLGATFWFDLLKKLVAIRGSGKSPEAEPTKKADIKFTKDQRDGSAEIIAEITK